MEIYEILGTCKIPLLNISIKIFTSIHNERPNKIFNKWTSV